MTLLALVVSADDSASEVLGRVLPGCGIAMERFSDLETAINRLQQQRFDAVVVDFEDPKAAAAVLAESRMRNSGRPVLTVALISEPAKVREILSGGAHFVLYKPLAEGKTRAGLRALTALLNRERRRAQRIVVQAPVELTLADSTKPEGILLDLSETGMEILTAQPQAPASEFGFRFHLPDGLEVKAEGRVAEFERIDEGPTRSLGECRLRPQRR
jgi:DNA-binding response OmpR family regulator